MAEIFDGRKLSERMEREIISELDSLGNPELRLHTILIGENEGSEIYIKMKEKSLARIGGSLFVHRFSSSVKPEDVTALIKELNSDPSVHGIMIELPLHSGFNIREFSSLIDPLKDVDCLNPENIGLLLQGNPRFSPPTPSAVMRIIKESGAGLKGAEVCVINHSPSVGRPLSMLLLNENATVHICHVFTRNLKERTKNADIVVVAAGVPSLIRADMIKEGAVIIDVGMNRVKGKIAGDVDFEGVSKKASFITPVPGGVGPVTRYTLLENLLKAYELGLR